MSKFPNLSLLGKSKRDENKDYYYYPDVEEAISYFPLENVNNVYFSSVTLSEDNYRTFFHSRDFETLDKLSREAVTYYDEEEANKTEKLEMYQ